MIFYINYWQEQGESPVLITGLVDGDINKPAMIRIDHDMFRDFIKNNGHETMPIIANVDPENQTIDAIRRN
tara:strand:- start:720 stop:932 length:213 start_codon:yes stop_codon:yes gene_type:complete